MHSRFRALALSAALALFPALALAQSAPQVSLPDPVGVGHVIAQGGVPVVTGGTLAAGSTDTAGEFTASAASGTLVFSKAYLTKPACILVDETATPIAVWTTTLSQITLTTLTNAHVYAYTCFGKIGG